MTDIENTANPDDEMVEIPRWIWDQLAPIVKEAVSLWYTPDGMMMYFPVGEVFRYAVPAPPPPPTGDDEEDAYNESLYELRTKRRGDEFLPLYRAVIEGVQVVSEPEVRELLGYGAEPPDGLSL